MRKKFIPLLWTACIIKMYSLILISGYKLPVQNIENRIFDKLRYVNHNCFTQRLLFCLHCRSSNL